MLETIDMFSLLNARGWKIFDTCFCKGVYTEKLHNSEKPGYKIHIMPKKKMKFLVKRNNMSVKEGNSYELEAYLNSI